MKPDNQEQLKPAPHEEQQIFDEISSDRELIDRLKISDGELEALSKCVLLGTLTCKQDMLFILRVIRDANSPAADRAPLALPPPDYLGVEEDEVALEEEPVPDFRRIAIR